MGAPVLLVLLAHAEGVPGIVSAPTISIAPSLTFSVVLTSVRKASHLRRLLGRIPDDVLEVVFVDDDSTGAMATAALDARPSVRIVSRGGGDDGTTLRTSIAEAQGDILVLLDGDNATSWSW